jgi:opacity protein-like surface antigen
MLFRISGELMIKFFCEGSPMKRIRKISSKRLLFITLFAFLMVLGYLTSHSYGYDLKNLQYGVSVFGGIGDALHSKTEFTTFGVLPRIGVPLHRNWDLEFEGNYSYWKIRREHDLYFVGIDANVIFKPIQGKWGSLFLLGGAGIGYDSAGKRVEQIGDSHFGAILQAGIGLYYNLGKRWALRVEYRFYHLSEPSRHDVGLNSHNVLLGISF